MFGQNTLQIATTINQTDRIQGMALYMNNEGAEIAWFPLTMIFFGMVLVVLLLKLFAERRERERKEAFEALKARRKAESLNDLSTKTRYRRRRR